MSSDTVCCRFTTGFEDEICDAEDGCDDLAFSFSSDSVGDSECKIVCVEGVTGEGGPVDFWSMASRVPSSKLKLVRVDRSVVIPPTVDLGDEGVLDGEAVLTELALAFCRWAS